MIKMNNFQIASQKERQKMTSLFEQRGITNYKFTDDNGYDQYDGWFESPKTNEIICFEVKNRAVSSLAYPTAILNEKKYQFMLDQTIGHPYAFIFYTNNKVLIEDLRSQSYKVTQMYLPATTANYGENIYKNTIEIPITKNNIYPFTLR